MTDYLEYLNNEYNNIIGLLGQHLVITFISVSLGILLAIPLGIYLTKVKSNFFRSIIFGIANVFQTVPTIALLAMMMPLFGIGMQPSIAALFLYSLLPVLRNTFAGINAVDAEAIDTARGMGLNKLQVLLKIELPLAVPYIISGIKITTVYVISWATLAATIGAGGLGELIISGISLNDEFMIFTGMILSVILAYAFNLIFTIFERSTSKTT